ncbi:MAG: MBL fold metallo-hydrolase [Nitrospira sp.]
MAQVAVSPEVVAPSFSRGYLHELRADIAYARLAIVNVAFIGRAEGKGWVLVDAGLAGSASYIRKAARTRFGEEKPQAIVLTHGHFDHVGALENLLADWDVPVFAHPLECPYLDGRASYPPADAKVGGGLMSLMSPLFPRGPINLHDRLHALSTDGSIPIFEDWRWIHTPGHSPGHVSLWRSSDRTLISGDAIISTKQESAYSVAKQSPEVHGPPMYFTVDWGAAHKSAEALSALEPDLMVTGHGPALQGPLLLGALRQLATDFVHVAVPPRGRYVNHPASVADGSVYFAR